VSSPAVAAVPSQSSEDDGEKFSYSNKPQGVVSPQIIRTTEFGFIEEVGLMTHEDASISEVKEGGFGEFVKLDTSFESTDRHAQEVDLLSSILTHSASTKIHTEPHHVRPAVLEAPLTSGQSTPEGHSPLNHHQPAVASPPSSPNHNTYYMFVATQHQLEGEAKSPQRPDESFGSDSSTLTDSSKAHSSNTADEFDDFEGFPSSSAALVAPQPDSMKALRSQPPPLTASLAALFPPASPHEADDKFSYDDKQKEEAPNSPQLFHSIEFGGVEEAGLMRNEDIKVSDIPQGFDALVKEEGAFPEANRQANEVETLTNILTNSSSSISAPSTGNDADFDEFGSFAAKGNQNDFAEFEESPPSQVPSPPLRAAHLHSPTQVPATPPMLRAATYAFPEVDHSLPVMSKMQSSLGSSDVIIEAPAITVTSDGSVLNADPFDDFEAFGPVSAASSNLTKSSDDGGFNYDPSPAVPRRSVEEDLVPGFVLPTSSPTKEAPKAVAPVPVETHKAPAPSISAPPKPAVVDKKRYDEDDGDDGDKAGGDLYNGNFDDEDGGYAGQAFPQSGADEDDDFDFQAPSQSAPKKGAPFHFLFLTDLTVLFSCRSTEARCG